MIAWEDIAKALSPGDSDRAEALLLAREWSTARPLARTRSSLLGLSDAAIALFYAELEKIARPRRPSLMEADSSWMLGADFCYLNARATGHGGRRGSFLQAAKILPAIGPSAIHLAPFHPVHFEVLYAPENQASLDPALAEPALTEAGINPEDQLRAFTLACRLLGKAVGYDLLPHLAQFGRTMVDSPELFRWIRLDDERKGLLADDPFRPYSASEREEAADQVRRISAAILADYGLDAFTRVETDSAEAAAKKDRAYFAAIRQCIDRGLWPVLSQAWNGVGAPAFSRYERGGDFPVFSYRNLEGADVGAEAYGVVSPFAFFDGLPPNETPDPENPPVPNPAAIAHYGAVYPPWRDGFGFDFVRYDSLDHVLDSCLDDEPTVPLSDRPTPAVVAAAIAASRSGNASATGALAERFGTELEPYSAMGVDLLLGSDWLRRVDAPFMRDSFSLYERLASRAEAGGCRPVSVCLAMDCHDAGNARFWGRDLCAAMGPERMGLRHGVGRFLCAGPVRRPFYETMGFQDGSAGLYASVVSDRPMAWADDKAQAARYAYIERLYARLRPFLDSARIVDRHVDERTAWWLIQGRAADCAKRGDRLVLCAASLETADGTAPGRVVLSLPAGQSPLSGVLYRLRDGSEAAVEASNRLELSLAYLDMVVIDAVILPAASD